MEARGEPRNLDDFATCGKPQNFPKWPAEFGKIFRGKLWALLMTVWRITEKIIRTAIIVTYAQL